ncbi:MAG: PcfJ domain-containing protein [SAR324 cluster bacterium]|nr:PcfJ domain-containing protein [SAR324 cluster bacterium]
MLFNVTKNSFLGSQRGLRIHVPALASEFQITNSNGILEWYSLENDLWLKEHTDIGFPIFSLSEHKTPEAIIYKDFFQDIDQDLCDRIRKFGTIQFLLGRWILRNQGAKDLFDSNPNLLWFLLSIVHEESWEEAEVIYVFTLKQKEIAALVIREKLAGAVNFFKKLTALGHYSSDFVFLKEFFEKSNSLEPYFHLGSIPLNLLELMNFWFLLGKWAISASAGIKTVNESAFFYSQVENSFYTFKESLRIANLLNIDFWGAISHFKLIREIEALHDRWSEEYQRRNPERPNERATSSSRRWDLFLDHIAGANRFPAPPITDTLLIKAIRSPHQLFVEGIEQKHCVYTYQNQVQSGECYIYKVLAPERATLLIKQKLGTCVIGQIQGKKNSQVSSETLRSIQDWLIEGQKKPV